MTDNELTRLAYMAAFSGADLLEDVDMLKRWSPLTDDGDALRLAVKLNMDILNCNGACSVNDGHSDEFVNEHNFEDPCAATRLAIVRAAAFIGKSL